MKIYTQAELDELISCPKIITEGPTRQMRLEGNQRRNDMGLREEDGGRTFEVFMRIHHEFAENFQSA